MSGVRDVLSHYKQRLISSDARSSTYYLSSLKPGRAIDLLDLFNDFSTNTESLIELIKNKKKIVFHEKKMNPEPIYKLLLDEPNGYQESVRNIIPWFTKKDFDSLHLILIEQMHKSSIDEKKELIDKIVLKYDAMINKKFLALSKLINKQNSIIRDFGKDDLYLGFPFIEGAFDITKGKEKVFRAPLILHRVNVSYKSGQASISFNNEPSIINPIFLISFLMESNSKYRKVEWEIPNTDFIEYCLSILDDYGIQYDANEFTKIDFFKEISKEQYIKNMSKVSRFFTIHSQAVLGIFPLSNRNIFNDLEVLEQLDIDVDSHLANFILENKNQTYENMYKPTNQIKRPDESQLDYITPLDFSQKNVLNSVLLGDSSNNMVIEGPPGTGKSQTIVNMITNYVKRHKSVLVVSEKVAAINVLFNRLADLKTHTVIIKDHIHDKQDFYNQLKQTIHSLGSKSTMIKNHVFNDVIERHFDFIEAINQPLDIDNHEEVFAWLETIQASDMFFDETLKEQIHSLPTSDDFNTFKSYINNLITEESLKLIKSFNSEKEFPVYDAFELKLLELLKHADQEKLSIQSLIFLQYIYKYESNLELPIRQDLKSGFTPKKSSIKAFVDWTEQLYHKLPIARQLILLEKSELGQLLKAKPSLMSLIKKWDHSSTRERFVLYKQTMDIKFKDGFFKRLFKIDIPLTAQDLNNLQVVQDNHLIFPLDRYQDILSKLSREELRIIRILDHLKFESRNELALALIEARYVEFDYPDLMNLKRHVKSFKDLDISLYKKVVNTYKVTEIDFLSTLTSYEECDLNEFKSLVLFKSLEEEIQDKIVSISHYFKSYETHYKSVQDAVTLKQEFSLKSTYHMIRESIDANFSRQPHTARLLKSLESKVDLKRKHSVRKIFDDFFPVLNQLYPIWLMTPETASALLPLEEGLFDVVVFDEASQLYIERSIPSIYRSKNVIVAGDSKQLRPTSTFLSRFVEDEETLSEIVDPFEEDARQAESLLDHAKKQYPFVQLEYHYRSEYKELIDFSSHAFYEGSLRFASKGIKDVDYPIKLIKVEDGFWENRQNQNEAKTVVNLIKDIINTRKHNESIGVVTFNVAQKQLIEELLEFEEHKGIKRELVRFNEKKLEDEALFVKNIESVQGDERDIIIFSIGYAKDKDGKVVSQFGSLSQSGGENRLNVAITRAKHQIFVVSSIEARELSVNTNNPGPTLFKNYLQYVEYLNQEQEDKVSTLLSALEGTSHYEQSRSHSQESEFEASVALEISQAIEDDRYILRRKIPVGNFSLDMGIYDTKINQYVLAIECDNAFQTNTENALERDYYRQVYLEERHWNIHRIWSTNWWRNKEAEIDAFKHLFNTLIRLNGRTIHELYQIQLEHFKVALYERMIPHVETQSLITYKVNDQMKKLNKYTNNKKIELEELDKLITEFEYVIKKEKQRELDVRYKPVLNNDSINEFVSSLFKDKIS
jgi:predicted AAA+ superfamily ATPase